MRSSNCLCEVLKSFKKSYIALSAHDSTNSESALHAERSATAVRTSTSMPYFALTDNSTTTPSALLQPREPAANRIEQDEHQEPNEIDARET